MRIPFGRRTHCALLLLIASLGTLLAPVLAAPRPEAPPVRIERVPVAPGHLVSTGYNGEARVLEIGFCSGAADRSLDVPAAVFEALKKAESKGRYFAQSIRGHYEFQRLRTSSP